MEINRKFNYESLERVTHENGSRYYVSPQGEHLSSVTTILSATSFNPQLEAWQKRVGLQEAERIRNEATGLGSLMHTHLENHVMGIERPKGNNLVRQMASRMADKIIESGLPHIDEIWGIEEILYMPGKYAGTSDLIGVHEGKQAIMDYKTCRKMKSKSSILDYSLQGAAYATAHDLIHGTNIERVVIFMVSRDLDFSEYIWEGEEFLKAKELWSMRLEAFLNSAPTAESPA